MDKFKMELTFHNCATYPPEETLNTHLLITDGFTVVFGKYSHGTFYWEGMPLSKDQCWWADIDQTVRGAKEFEEA